MKNLTIATILIGLTGTAASAAVDLSSLPADIQSQVQAAGQAAQDPFQTCTDSVNSQVSKKQDDVKSFITQYPYLADFSVAQYIQDTMNSAYSDISDKLKTLSDISTPVGQDLAQLDSLYSNLQKQIFPAGCQYAKDNKTGYVEKMLAQPNKYALYSSKDTTQPPLAIFDPSEQYVGQIGTGKEYVITSALDEMVDAFVWDNNGTQTVGCMVRAQ